MRIAVITSRPVFAAPGEAAMYPHGLLDALRSAGHDARELPIRTDHSSFAATLDSYTRCYALDLQAFDLVISTAAPTFMASHPNHTSYLAGVLRSCYDPLGGAADLPGGRSEQRRAVQALDRFGLRPGRIRRHFSWGHAAYRLLRRSSSWWTSVHSQPLHLPPTLTGFKAPRAPRHILVPRGLESSARVDLILDAYRHLPNDIPLLIVGSGGEELRLRALAGDDRRIRFVGDVPDADLLDLYAEALLVPCVGLRLEHATTAIEAFKSSKPVLTCTDSGESLDIVRDADTGYVVSPTVEAIARALRSAADRPSEAAARGARGAQCAAPITWERMVETLTGQRRHSPLRRVRAAEPPSRRFRIAILDGEYGETGTLGSRSRLTGLFHALGPGLHATRVGIAPCPVPVAASSRTLDSIDVALGARHQEMRAGWRRTVSESAVDLALAHHLRRSAEYVRLVRRQVAESEVIVFWRPWVYPLVSDLLDSRRHLVVYAAQDVEALTLTRESRRQPFGAALAARAAVVERDVCRAADVVLVRSHRERLLFHELYDIPLGSCAIVADGTFTAHAVATHGAGRAAARHALRLPPGPMALFIGDRPGVDDEAAQFINGTLAPALPVVTIVLAGEAGTRLPARAVAPNVRLFASVSDEQRRLLIEAADVGVLPEADATPHDRTLFDYLAAGVPVVATSAATDRLTIGAHTACVVAARESFAPAIARLLRDEPLAAAVGGAGRRLVTDRHSWERLSPALGRLLHRHRHVLGKARPAVSVIVTTRDRHDGVDVLMEYLTRQTLRHFEVIVVDHGTQRWTPAPMLPLDVVHIVTPDRGIGDAANTGAAHARADVLAFTTDDSRPDADWLENALPYFQRADVVGLEGAIVSDRLQDPRVHAFTNVGNEGLVFSTANLFLRREVFGALDGFDPQFDSPFPSREGTDLAWRALDRGAIPFADDVRVYQPPRPRTAIEAFAAHEQGFDKDALLLKKHPGRARQLLLRHGDAADTLLPEHIDLNRSSRTRCGPDALAWRDRATGHH